VTTDGVDVVATALVEIVAPASVLDVGSGGSWAKAFSALGVNDVEVAAQDLRSPLVFDRHFDLGVCAGVADHVPPDVVPGLVASLVRAADVVAFSAPLPGVAPSATAPARWPAWWDSVFEQHGYEPHDVVRWKLWDDDRVDLAVRSGLVLYAAAGRFATVAAPPAVIRGIVHPEAHHRALHLARRHLDAEMRAANARLAELDAAVTSTEEQQRLTAGDLEIAYTRIGELEQLTGVGDIPAVLAQLERAERDAATNRSDAALLWAALAQAERELTAATTVGFPSAHSLRAAPKRQFVRFVTTALPLRRGFRRILGPSARLFDEHWYVARYPDVATSALSPLWHYRRHGSVMRRSPAPFFDPAWYIERYPDVGASGADPLEHYLKTGWREGRDPHPLFSTDWYVSQAAMKRWRRSPLEHYLSHGRPQGASPHPLIDPAYYLANNRDIAKAGVDPVDHFLARGWWEGRSPHPLFDVRWYLDTYTDVASTGENPLVQYLRQGWREGRDPNPLFDVTWYLESYEDVAASGLEPLSHYLAAGADEGRSTGPLFDTAWYVAAHPEATRNGSNPLTYFLEVGASRGHVPSPWADELLSAALSGDGYERFSMKDRHPVPRVLL
jgi:hypothetical protein